MDGLEASILTELRRHLATYGIGSGVLLLGVIQHIPKAPPKSIQDWWTWMRESLMTVLPINRTASTQTQMTTITPTSSEVIERKTETPTTPAEPAQPKE
jgi:hypothetical protein